MNRSGRFGLTLAAVLAAGAGGHLAGERGLRWPAFIQTRLAQATSAAVPVPAAASGAVIYYRDPDGRPVFSALPTKAADGRDFVAVRASEDICFDDGAPKAAEAAPVPDAARILYYRNPMGLPDTSPTPKKDSMGMDYIAVRASEDEDGSTVTVSTGKLQRSGVRSEPATRRVLSQPIRAPGVIREDERLVSLVALRGAGFVETVEPITTGDHVRKGQPLMQIYSPDIAAAAAQYLSAVAPSSGSAPAIVEGARRRLENLDVPAEVMSEIERTKKVPTSITWRAPRDGVVIERNAVNGMKAESGGVMFRIVDHSVVWVLTDVAERDLSVVAEGQKVNIRVRAYPNRTFSGKVTRIYPEMMKETRTARLRIELPNRDALLRPEMYVDAEIMTGTDAPVVAVPTSAVIDSGSRQVVILDKGKGRFEPRPVTVGRRGDGYVEIVDGVAEGQSVVVTANFLIDAESNLKAALQGLALQGLAPQEALR